MIINIVRGLLFKQCKLGIGNVDDKWFEDILKTQHATWKRLDFLKKQILVQRDVKHVSRPGYLGVQYHVAGLLDFDVEVDIPGRIQCI